MTGHSLVWSDGRWGEANALQLPLNDRGLLLADGLFETVLVLDGRARLLEPHLERWRRSAALLGLPEPPQTAVVQPLVEEAIARCNLPAGQGALRLNWSAGSGGRGLDRPDTLDPRFWLQLSAHAPTFAPVQVIVSRHERRNGSSRLSHCKTFAYGQAVQARREARGAGAEDALLLSTSGELCCGTAANLLVQRQGQWLTPALSSGCLPGIMRGQLLERGLATESQLDATPQDGDRWLLINSLSCRPITSVDGAALTPLSLEEVRALFDPLLAD